MNYIWKGLLDFLSVVGLFTLGIILMMYLHGGVLSCTSTWWGWTWCLLKFPIGG